MRTRFITSGADPAGFPPHAMGEVAFVGRSNVGKSSLLNAIAQASIARTSKTPGRTQLINFFEIADKRGACVLADLPGYGFARAPGPARAQWMRLTESYLTDRPPLRAVCLLLDLRREVDPMDREIYEWIGSSGAGGTVWAVATKCDKFSKAHLKPAVAALAAGLGVAAADVHATSTASGFGIDTLRARIFARCGDQSPSGNRP